MLYWFRVKSLEIYLAPSDPLPPTMQRAKELWEQVKGKDTVSTELFDEIASLIKQHLIVSYVPEVISNIVDKEDDIFLSQDYLDVDYTIDRLVGGTGDKLPEIFLHGEIDLPITLDVHEVEAWEDAHTLLSGCPFSTSRSSPSSGPQIGKTLMDGF